MADEKSYAYICGIGMTTAVGDSTAMTSSSVRAGINRFTQSNIMNKNYAFMTMAQIPEENLPPLTTELSNLCGLSTRERRMLRVADTALKEVLANFPKDHSLPLYLAVPETLPELSNAVSDDFIRQLVQQTGANIDVTQSAMFPMGRAGGFLALEAAMNALTEEQHDLVLVGGIDSYLDPMLLGTLDIDDRILAMNVMDGFAPGEGAGFLLLASFRMRQHLGSNRLAIIFPPGVASEEGHRFSDQPYKGDGLADAFRAAFQNGDPLPVRTIFSSLNGENFGAKEYGVASLRNNDKIDEDVRLEHPADCFGDIGAATGPVLIGLSSMGMLKNYIPSPVLAYGSSELEPRGAAYLTIES